MKKLTLALPAAAALAAVTIGLATPAVAAPTTGPAPAASIGANHGGYPLDCSVHVLYQGADVDVNWC
jgi:invasion protein IalB